MHVSDVEGYKVLGDIQFEPLWYWGYGTWRTAHLHMLSVFPAASSAISSDRVLWLCISSSMSNLHPDQWFLLPLGNVSFFVVFAAATDVNGTSNAGGAAAESSHNIVPSNPSSVGHISMHWGEDNDMLSWWGYREYILCTVIVIKGAGTGGADCGWFIVAGRVAPGGCWVWGGNTHCNVMQWFALTRDNCPDLNSSTIAFQGDWSIFLLFTGCAEGHVLVAISVVLYFKEVWWCMSWSRITEALQGFCEFGHDEGVAGLLSSQDSSGCIIRIHEGTRSWGFTFCLHSSYTSSQVRVCTLEFHKHLQVFLVNPLVLWVRIPHPFDKVLQFAPSSVVPWV